jgi:hypothetical protein
MAWLRLRPPTFEDLDAVDSRGRLVQEKDSDEEDGADGPGRRGRFDDVRPCADLRRISLTTVSG